MLKDGHEKKVWATYNERWSRWGDVRGEILKKLKDREYAVRNETVINQVNRFVLAYDFLEKNVRKGARVIDAACGPGFATCILREKGFDAVGFDFSPVAIEQAEALAARLKLAPGAFVNQDHAYLDKVPARSVDAVLAMGYLRYVDAEVRDKVYRNVHRVLKPRGYFLVSNTNLLFAMFALNDFTLKFWAEAVSGFSDARKLLPGRDVLKALGSQVKTPTRQYAAHSVARRAATHEENPLTFPSLAEGYGFEVLETRYPDPHMLPPFLEKAVDPKRLDGIKGKTCLKRSDDWRSMFMCYEFLSFLRKR